ncbi:hypothetical protein K469DRAFT_700621 [Zopfia rhizophila CBS 207.26]|uniref:Uncharacterized protein n=1 Tax=Zopfia rhizophila CBS 207.26 TaxID=1314779 RepID=A0A6A6EHT9_9PEZI|nr:hypothetical protein K469DRAFT_700621 [Zopfia rhizophila CBS 207.26]
MELGIFGLLPLAFVLGRRPVFLFAIAVASVSPRCRLQRSLQWSFRQPYLLGIGIGLYRASTAFNHLERYFHR